ncbi:MAG: RNA methyltransferase [Chloroflexi bacterium]|nr:RNA methyltransferase [Chloroflexota bacterium]
MDAVHISSSSNPRYKHARALQRKRGRLQHHQVLLEGVRLIEDSISAGYPPALLFVDPAKANEMAPLLGRARLAGVQTFSLEPALLALLSETVTPQGVIAVSPLPAIKPGSNGLSVILDGLRDPGNLGTLLRSASAAAVDQVIVLPGVTDPWAPKVLRAGMGAHYRLAIRAAQRLQQVDAWVGNARPYQADARGAKLYTEIDWTLPAVLVIGGETASRRATSGWRDVQKISIPMANEVESLNAAMAAGIILFEAVRQRTRK